jgi:hypothetical protein
VISKRRGTGTRVIILVSLVVARWGTSCAGMTREEALREIKQNDDRSTCHARSNKWKLRIEQSL